jgi:toxin-antitoxin system PIN domain toxin
LIVVDANVLLYAYDSASRAHEPCRAWLTAALNGREQIGLPWQTLLVFIRIATNSRVFRAPLSGEHACAIVAQWLAQPQVIVISPGDRFWPIFEDLVRRAQIVGPLVSDAALAALAIESGAILCSTDRDFRRFDTLKLIDPTD